MELHEISKEIARLEREHPGKKVIVNVSRINRVGHDTRINCEIIIR